MVIGRPSLWAIGALGFALRGGIVLLLLPILVLPTPVEARLALGTNLGSAGLTPLFLSNVALAGALLIIPLSLALMALAQLELVAFERVVTDDETIEQRGQSTVVPVRGRERFRLFGELVFLQVTAFVFIAAAALPLAKGIVQVTTDEILRPSVPGGSIYLRVFSGVREPLIALLVAVVIVEVIAAIVSRQLMARRFGLAGGVGSGSGTAGGSVVRASFGRLIRQPLGILATAALGWALSLAVLGPVLWTLLLAWDAVRSTYLATGLQTDPQAIVGLVLVTVALAAVFVAGLLLCGIVSALRAALWTMEGLRRS